MKYFLTIIVGLALIIPEGTQAQTNLFPGDIAFTGVNMDNPDEFSIVFLVDIAIGTEIRFTDNGWKADSTFRTGEGTFLWTSQQAYTAGEEIILLPEGLGLSSSGDQILAYQGDNDNPVFIAAYNDEGEHIWQEDATNSNTSALPLSLVIASTCVAQDETDNLIYNRAITSGTQEELLSAINNYTNWTGSNTQRQSLSTAGVTVSGGNINIPQLVINEIYYNGPESPDDTIEFIEIYNADTTTVFLEGYYFSQGVSFTFPVDATINSGEFIIITNNASVFSGSGYQVFEWVNDSLSNTGEAIEMNNPGGSQVDIVDFSDSWGNQAPDGFGPSLELINPANENNLEESWRASYFNGGTPGTNNSSPPALAEWQGGVPGAENSWAVPGNWVNDTSAGFSTDMIISTGNTSLLTIDGNFNCHDLNVNPGGMFTIESQGGLTVHGNLTLQSDSTGTASVVLVDTNAMLNVEGISIIEQYLSGGLVRDPVDALYHYVSLPVTTGVTGNVFPGGAFVRRYNEPLQLWENLSSPDTLMRMVGYNVWLEGGTENVTFEGVLNNGDLYLEGLTFTGPGIPNYNPTYAGYHLIGNPYPSAIDWDHQNITKTNLDNAIYFWNPLYGGYSTYVDGVGNNPETTNAIIPPMQGFFVRVDAIGHTGSLALKNEARVHPDKIFYKRTEDKILRLNVSGAEGGDQTAVRFKALSTEGFDSYYDARKLCGGFGIPQLYSVTSDAVEMAINTLPSIEENGLVNIGFAADIPDLYEITVSGIENFDQNTAIYLEDIFENNTIDLRVVSNYFFTYSTGDDPDRFRLHFSNTMNNHDTDGTSTNIYSAGNSIYINGLAHEETIRIEIFNIVGQKILEKISTENGFYKITIREGKGIFFVRITSGGKTMVKKVYIN